jgi:Na+/melibiose symporter-like transporter
MTRVVRGADGRVWTLQSDMEWRTPATADDFEHDVSLGHGPAMVLLLLVTVLAVVLVVWTPRDVYVPLWLVLIILLVVLFFPIRWALRRPWKVVAETGDDGEGEPVEKWVGTVRGVLTVRQEVAKIARDIVVDAMPGLDGPLKPVG